jgi:hypothetical protein
MGCGTSSSSSSSWSTKINIKDNRPLFTNRIVSFANDKVIIQSLINNQKFVMDCVIPCRLSLIHDRYVLSDHKKNWIIFVGYRHYEHHANLYCMFINLETHCYHEFYFGYSYCPQMETIQTVKIHDTNSTCCVITSESTYEINLLTEFVTCRYSNTFDQLAQFVNVTDTRPRSHHPSTSTIDMKSDKDNITFNMNENRSVTIPNTLINNQDNQFPLRYRTMSVISSSSALSLLSSQPLTILLEVRHPDILGLHIITIDQRTLQYTITVAQDIPDMMMTSSNPSKPIFNSHFTLNQSNTYMITNGSLTSIVTPSSCTSINAFYFPHRHLSSTLVLTYDIYVFRRLLSSLYITQPLIDIIQSYAL